MKGNFAKVPRRNNQPKHNQYQPAGDCSTKRRYLTEAEALRVGEIQMLQNPGLELSVYRCPSCGGWHLTRRPVVK